MQNVKRAIECMRRGNWTELEEVATPAECGRGGFSWHRRSDKIRPRSDFSVRNSDGISIRNPMKFSVLDENFGLARLLGCFFDFLCVSGSFCCRVTNESYLDH